MKELLQNYNKKCTGCGCCVNICPESAIEMRYDEQYDGSLEARIIREKCVNCKKCERACPLLNDYEKSNSNDPSPDLYAVQAYDQIRFKSSSGGAFTALASYVLSEKGYVCGVEFGEEFKPVFSIISDEKDLDRLRGSKYTQADTGEVFSAVKDLLLNNETVLFTGCPCQVAGLHSFLGKEMPNLITVDLICSNTPPYPAFKKYLTEKYDIKRIKNIRFRTKTCGWVSDICEVTDMNGETQVLRSWNDSYQKAYHPLLMMRKTCEQCHFAGLPRVGDFSIGDFWFIDQFEQDLDDKRGTSCLYVNNDKAKDVFQKVKDSFKLCRKVPLDYMKYNRQPGRKAHAARDHFYKLLKRYPFEEAVDKALNSKFDIGLFGVWTEKNYGSEITYFALYKVLEKLGYDVLAIERPNGIAWPNGPNTTPVLFKENPYPSYASAFNVYSKTDLKMLNKQCDTFMIGSDQMWHYDLYEAFGKTTLLDFAHNDKKKISYATSFGREKWTGPDEAIAEISFYMKRFDYISVRESSGVEICKENFGVSAECVLDPVFLCEKEEFRNLANCSQLRNKNDGYIGVYMLDPTQAKMQVVHEAEKKLGKRAHVIADAGFNQTDFSQWENKMTENAFVEDWICNILQADYVITDSFHGVCFSIIFNKPFTALVNKSRGATRFYELLTPLKLVDRLIDAERDDDEHLSLEPIDYEFVNHIIAEKKKASTEWLENALRAEKKYVKNELDYAIERLEDAEVNICMLAKELRERNAWYGDRLDGLERDRMYHYSSLVDQDSRLRNIEGFVYKVKHPVKALPGYIKNKVKK